MLGEVRRSRPRRARRAGALLLTAMLKISSDRVCLRGKRRSLRSSPARLRSRLDHVLAVAAVEDREAGLEADRARRSGAARCWRRSGTCRRATRSQPPPTSAAARRSISSAALRVKVRSRICAGVDARLDEARDAIHQRARLAAAGARDDQHRPFDVRHGRVLRGVQLAGVVDAEARRGLSVRACAERVAVSIRGSGLCSGIDR